MKKLFLLFLLLSQSINARNAGELDLTFGTNGLAQENIGGTLTTTVAIAIQSDNQIIFAGSALDSSNLGSISRFSASGALDTANFGNPNGYTTLLPAGYTRANFNDVTIQSDEKIFVVGLVDNSASPLLGQSGLIAKFDTDGTLDTSFANPNGYNILIDSISTNTLTFDSAAVQADGKIVAVGSTAGHLGRIVIVARYQTDGTLDAGNFGGADGFVTTRITGTDDGLGVAIQSSNQKIVVSGKADANQLVIRYNTDGTLDIGNFGGANGYVTTDVSGANSGEDLVIQSDGKIIVSTVSNANFAMARYDSDGALDATFGTGGKVTTNTGSSGSSYQIELQSDGKIILAGISPDGAGGSSPTFARYDSNGSLDTSFGLVRISTAAAVNTDGIGLGIQSNDKIIGGFNYSGSSGDALLMRLLSTETLQLEELGFGDPSANRLVAAIVAKYGP